MKTGPLMVLALAVVVSLTVAMWPSFLIEDASGAAHSLGHAFFLSPPAPDDENLATVDMVELAWELLSIWCLAIISTYF